MVLLKVCFSCWLQVYNETRGPKVSKSCRFLILSETTGAIRSKLSRNVHWMVLWKLIFSLCRLEIQKRTRGSKRMLSDLDLLWNQGSIGTKLGRNVPWMALLKSFFWLEVQVAQTCQKGCCVWSFYFSTNLLNSFKNTCMVYVNRFLFQRYELTKGLILID